jgi:C4-dicarboxylate-specific signal transduction histidine kinase
VDPRLRIVHVEDDAVDSALVVETLDAGGFRCDVTRVDAEPAFTALLDQGCFDLILADYTLPSFDGFSALKLATSRCPNVPFIFVSGTLDEEVAIESLKIGATDYVFKTKLSRLVPSVQRALRESAERARRAEAEKALHATQAELAHASRLMTMGQMAASIAHEVNQPLSAVILNGKASLAWLSRAAPPLSEVREAIEAVVADATRAGEIIARIRAMTKKTTTGKERVHLNETIDQVLVLVRGELQKNRIVLRTDFRADLPQVLGDRIQLQQLLLNLFMNAIEAMNGVDGPRELTVTTGEYDAAEAVVMVRDSGVGLDAASRARLFDAFYTTKPNGMGLGLSISRSIVQNHRGRLWVEANDGPGTTFRFTVPKAAR